MVSIKDTKVEKIRKVGIRERERETDRERQRETE